MSFNNINDPAGVTALLEKLRSSQAWADLQNPPAPSNFTVDSVLSAPEPSCAQQDTHMCPPQSVSPALDPSPSVSTLLFQLQSNTSQAHTGYSTQPLTTSPFSEISAEYVKNTLVPDLVKRPDFRSSTFQQALPLIASLSENTTFLHSLYKLRDEQDVIEKQLWEERQALCHAQDEKVKVAITKAKMLGTGISEREAATMAINFQKELQKFDRERVLPAWDGLIMKQQIKLEALGVPAMFATNNAPDRERQQRVVQVLEGLTSPQMVD